MKLRYIRNLTSFEAHPESVTHDNDEICDKCILAQDESGLEFMLWSIQGQYWVLHRLDPKYTNRDLYTDIEVFYP